MPSRPRTTAADFLPEKLEWNALREAAEHCRGCDLYKHATQVVFGEGKQHAGIMLVGEVPGDQEDRRGRPFVGPAGRLLDEALDRADLKRSDVYVTNAVKHFKWEERGRRQLHKKPNRAEIVSCRAWLDAEIALVQPRVLVCLGATAAQSLLGPKFRITQQRGQPLESDLANWILATWHPSAILRAPAKVDRNAMRDDFASDLATAARLAQ